MSLLNIACFSVVLFILNTGFHHFLKDRTWGHSTAIAALAVFLYLIFVTIFKAIGIM